METPEGVETMKELEGVADRYSWEAIRVLSQFDPIIADCLSLRDQSDEKKLLMMVVESASDRARLLKELVKLNSSKPIIVQLGISSAIQLELDPLLACKDTEKEQIMDRSDKNDWRVLTWDEVTDGQTIFIALPDVEPFQARGPLEIHSVERKTIFDADGNLDNRLNGNKESITLLVPITDEEKKDKLIYTRSLGKAMVNPTTYEMASSLELMENIEDFCRSRAFIESQLPMALVSWLGARIGGKTTHVMLLAGSTVDRAMHMKLTDKICRMYFVEGSLVLSSSITVNMTEDTVASNLFAFRSSNRSDVGDIMSEAGLWYAELCAAEQRTKLTITAISESDLCEAAAMLRRGL